MNNQVITSVDNNNVFVAQFFEDGSTRVTYTTFSPVGPVTSVIPFPLETLKALVTQAEAALVKAVADAKVANINEAKPKSKSKTKRVSSK